VAEQSGQLRQHGCRSPALPGPAAGRRLARASKRRLLENTPNCSARMAPHREAGKPELFRGPLMAATLFLFGWRVLHQTEDDHPSATAEAQLYFPR